MKHDSNSEEIDKTTGKSRKYKKFGEKCISEYLKQENRLLYQKDEYNHLNNHYRTVRTELYNQKRSAKQLNQKFNEVNKNWKEQEKLVKNLKKENSILKSRIEAFKTRKIVRLTDMILRLLNKNGSKNIQTGNTQRSKTHPKKIVKTPKISTVDVKKILPDNSKPKYLKDIKVAVIMDEFTYNSFKYEFDAYIVEPDNWKEIFETEKPDLFLCESAWHGINPETKPWSRKISTNLNSKKENRTELLEILDYCKKHQIPSIFWNKEDPTHYHNQISSFADTAAKFDHIFTSAKECIKEYKTDYGHGSVHSLMFAAQPRLFNPIEEDERTDDVIFAGSWYAHHPERCEEMRNMFNRVLIEGYKLKIYDRTFYSKLNDSFNFPVEYNDFVNPSVPHDQMAKVYKESKYAININTVTDSNTMFARRVFELILCNTIVLSNHSKGLEKLFKNNIIYMDQNQINLVHTKEKRLKNLYNVLENHTYTNRFKQILKTINYPYKETEKTVTVYYQTENRTETENAAKHYQTLDYPHKKAIILEQTKAESMTKTLTSKQNKNPDITIKPLHNPEELKDITNYTSHFIFADTKLKPDFIKKAILHYSYIKNKYGIAEGKSFTFKNTINIKNTLFNNQEFQKILKQVNSNIQLISIYSIET